LVAFGELEDQLAGGSGIRIDVARPRRQDTGAHVVVHTGYWNSPVPHGLDEHAEAGQIGDVEDDDEIGAAELPDRLMGPVDPGQVVKQEAEARRGGARVGDDRLDALGSQQVNQPDLAAEPIAVRVDVGGDADPLTRPKRGGKGTGQGGLFGGQRKRHFQY
jgi:hypothetical protein